MDLSGSTLVAKQDLQKRLLELGRQQSVLDREDLALLLPPLFKQAEGKRLWARQRAGLPVLK